VLRRAVFGCVIFSLSWLIACGTPAPPSTLPAPQPDRTDAFLVDPFEGYPLQPTAALEQRIRDAYAVLVRQGAPEVAHEEAEAVLEVDPGFHPAHVLAAQSALLLGRGRDALDRTRPVVEELPEYRAAAWVLALAAEDLSRVVAAYEALLPLAPDWPEATERAERLRIRAVEITHNRFVEALDRGHLEAAGSELERLHEWVGDQPETLEAAWRLARALGAEETERLVLERMVLADPARRETAERLAELEIGGGSLRVGLSRLEALALEYPDDPALLDLVERAKFRWRLENFPDDIRALARSPELTRADFATLLFWLVPEVRYADLEAPAVATDILDHPRRDEVVRVLNLSLLQVDQTVHRFVPERAVMRGEALAAFLRLLARGQPDAACLLDVDVTRLSKWSDLTCDCAVRCGLIPEAADCLPAAPVSGDEALELFRLGLAPANH
jgi:hypothetical protein